MKTIIVTVIEDGVITSCRKVVMEKNPLFGDVALSENEKLSLKQVAAKEVFGRVPEVIKPTFIQSVVNAVKGFFG